MDEKLREEVRLRLSRRESPTRIRAELLQAGYGEEDVEGSLREVADSHLQEREAGDRRNSRILAAREVIDRVGYGAASPQFVNILFWMSGAGLFLIGLVNGLRAVLTLLITAVTQEYARVHKVGRDVIVAAGVLFGFSFLLMAFAVRTRNPWLFAGAMLLAALGVVTYGDLYQKLVIETIRREKMGGFLRRMGQYGILITMVSMLASGWLIDAFPETRGLTFSLWGLTFTPLGYLLSFWLTAFAFIISGYLLSLLRVRREERSYRLGRFIREHCAALAANARSLAAKRYVLLLILATAITGLLEVLGQSYYGLFLYRTFKGAALGGFLNVALLYSIAILASFTGPWFTRRLQRAIGLSPMLVFGTLLTAILPLTLAINPHFLSAAVALVCSVIGGAIVGVAQGLLARKLMDEATRRRYFMSLGLLVSGPYLLLVPLGAFLAASLGLEALFLIVGLGLAVVVAPLYFLLVALANKERL